MTVCGCLKATAAASSQDVACMSHAGKGMLGRRVEILPISVLVLLALHAPSAKTLGSRKSELSVFVTLD